MITLLADSHEQMMEYEQFLMNLRQESVGVIFLLQAIHIEMPAASGCDSAKGCFKSWCRVVHWARMKYVVKCLVQKLLPGYHIRALRANLRGGVPPWRSVDERTGPPKHLTLGVVVESCITGDRGPVSLNWRPVPCVRYRAEVSSAAPVCVVSVNTSLASMPR